MTMEIIRRRILKLLLLTGILAGTLLLAGATTIAEDPLAFSIEISPHTMEAPTTLDVTITVANMAAEGDPINVTLLDPSGETCIAFGRSGTASIAPGAAASYVARWQVTDQQLAHGRVTYTARYQNQTVTDGDAVVTYPISARITQGPAKAAGAQMNIERNVEPGAEVMQGQTVTIRYVMRNTGTVDLENIKIADPGITEEPAIRGSLAVGDVAEISYQYVASGAAKTTHAKISYQYEMDGKKETSKTISADPPITIEVVVPDLSVEISAQQIVNAGDKVSLHYTITNNSDMTYDDITVTDAVLGDIVWDLMLEPGTGFEGDQDFVVREPLTLQFDVTATSEAGQMAAFVSNILTIQTTDSMEAPEQAIPLLEPRVTGGIVSTP